MTQILPVISNLQVLQLKIQTSKINGIYTEMTLFESGNIKQSFCGSISARGTLDQKLQPGNNNNIAKIKICKNWNLVSLHFIWLRSLKICVFQAINDNS